MVTVGGLPTAMCLAGQADPGEDRLVLEVGNASSSLFIVSEGRLQLIRSFPTPVAADNRAGMLGAFVQRTLAAYNELCQTEFQPPPKVLIGTFHRNNSAGIAVPFHNTCYLILPFLQEDDDEQWFEVLEC